MNSNPSPQPDQPPLDDVRMRGFQRRATLAEARRWLDEQLAPLPAETALLDQAAGRALAEPIVSPVDVPGFDRSMMDGFALRAADTQGASAYNPLELQIVGDALPGQPFEGEVQPGQTVRCMTGAPIPAGADAVLPVEQTESAGIMLRAIDAAVPGKHIARRGEDIAQGNLLLPAGRILRPQDVGALSSIGINEIAVVARPSVRILVTGNEVLPPGSVPRDYKITDANGPMLRAAARRDGAGSIELLHLPDEPEAIGRAMQEPADILIVTGGSSVGAEDFAPGLLARHGTLAVHGIAMRPAAPTGLGRLGRTIVFLLPGNPVACLCAYDLLVGRAVRVLGGRGPESPYRTIRRPLARKIASTIGRVEYVRVRIVDERVEPLAVGGAGNLSSTVRADGYVLIEQDSEGFPAGAEVEVFLYD